MQVSVVMPAYNDERFIVEALDSILAQTVLPGEITVVDDSSDDGTPRLVADYIERHGHRVPMRSLRQPSRSGAEAARNLGVHESRGEWIAMCDSDDLWLPTKLERQLAFIEQWTGAGDLVAVGTQGFNINIGGRVISPLSLGLTTEAEFEARRRRHALMFVAHCSVLLRREALLRVGGYRLDYAGTEDLELFSRMAEVGVVINLDEHLVHYRKRPGSMQHTFFWEQQDNLLRISANARRRAQGQDEFTFEQFREELRATSRRQRLRRWRQRRGKFYYRTGSTNVVNDRRLVGGAQLALAAVFEPSRVLGGVRAAVAHNHPIRSMWQGRSAPIL